MGNSVTAKEVLIRMEDFCQSNEKDHKRYEGDIKTMGEEIKSLGKEFNRKMGAWGVIIGILAFIGSAIGAGIIGYFFSKL